MTGERRGARAAVERMIGRIVRHGEQQQRQLGTPPISPDEARAIARGAALRHDSREE